MIFWEGEESFGSKLLKPKGDQQKRNISTESKMSSKEIKLRKIIPKGEWALMLPVVSSDILALTFWRLSAT